MEAVFESMREENSELTARLMHLQKVIDRQIEAQSAADERLRELNAERSEALMTFMRQHAEEDHRKAELDRCTKKSRAAWIRMKALQERQSDVLQKIAQHKAEAEKANAHQESHRKRLERRDLQLSASIAILQHECDAVVEKIADKDNRRHEQMVLHAAMREAADNPDADPMMDEASANSGRDSNDVTLPKAAARDAPTGTALLDVSPEQQPAYNEERSDEDLEHNILELLTQHPQANASMILAHSRQNARTSYGDPATKSQAILRAVERLQETFLICARACL
jgi:hypothetical protein